MAYATAAELKTYLGISGAGDDALLTALIARAQAAVDAWCNRVFEAATTTKYYADDNLDDDGITLFLGDDLLTITTLSNGDSSATAILNTEYVLQPRNEGPPYFEIRLNVNSTHSWEWDTDCWVAVAGTWGYSTTVPDDVKHGCIRLAGYYYRQKDAQVFDVTAFPEAGVMTLPQGMPRDVRLILERYRRYL